MTHLSTPVLSRCLFQSLLLREDEALAWGAFTSCQARRNTHQLERLDFLASSDLAFLVGGGKDGGARLFSVVPRERARGKRHKLKHVNSTST